MSQFDCNLVGETYEHTALEPKEADERFGREVYSASGSETAFFAGQFGLVLSQNQKHLPDVVLFDPEAANGQDADSAAKVTPTSEAAPPNNPDGLSGEADADAFQPRQREPVSLENENLDKASTTGVSHLTAEDIQALVAKNFGRLDTNGDGFISKTELDEATVDKTLQGDDARLVAVLKEHRQNLEELSNDEWGDENDGITKADIEKFSEILKKADQSKSEEGLISDINRILCESGKSINIANRDLFANKDNPLASINPDAIKQGEIGDCYFLGALAALASSRQGKESIRNMIKDNGNGTYTVTFPGAKGKPVTVEAPTDAELARYAQGSADGIWPAVLEKAYGKHCDANNIDPHEGIPDGGTEEMGLEVLTGRTVDTDLLALTSKEATHKKLAEAMTDGRPVTAGIYGELGEGFGLADGNTDDAGIPSGHLYTIQAYDPISRTVTIRNPWGKGEPTAFLGMAKDGENDGVFKMSLDEFYKNFSSVSYAEKN